MMFPNLSSLYRPVLIEPEEAEVIWPWKTRERYWRVLSLSLTFTGFLICFACAFYFLLFNHSEFIYFTIAALICLMVFVHLVSGNCRFMNIARPMSAVPVQIASGEHFREVLRRTQSESGLSLIPEGADFFHSLPAYILIPTERQDRDESSNASTESTLSAESTKRHEEESELIANPQKQQVLNKPATSGPCAASKLSEAAAVISEIVRDDILDKEDNASTVATTAAEQSSNNCSEKWKETNKERVRQRKPTPIKAREYIPLTGNLKA